jgi:hypothetical protein
VESIDRREFRLGGRHVIIRVDQGGNAVELPYAEGI